MSWLSWRTRWRVYEYVRNSPWIVPFLGVALAVALAVVLPRVDESTDTTIGLEFGADAARAALGAIASGMITFTGFVFSIFLLAVQFGSSQFSPRMLRRFLRDPSTKAALATFMATFVYALGVLREVGTGQEEDFVPNNAIAVAMLFLLLSMVMFLRLLSRTTQGLRVAAVLAELGRDARRVVDRVYPEPAGDEETEDADALPGGAARTVAFHGAPGVVQSVDVRSIVARAREAGVVVTLCPRLGELVADGSPLFTVHGERDRRLDDAWLRGTVATGDERSMRQDPAFALRLLADISAKALSPGVNDPTTSVQALDQIDLLLRRLGTRRLTPGIARDGHGDVRYRYRAPTWEDFLSLALDETRHYGEGSVQVMRRMRALCENVRASVPAFRQPAVDAEAALLQTAATRAFPDVRDQRAAAAADRQGLGATEILVPRRPTEAPEPHGT